MTLDESKDNFDKLESNGVVAYIDPQLNEHLEKMGNINIDFTTGPDGHSGYMIKVGSGDCGSCSC